MLFRFKSIWPVIIFFAGLFYALTCNAQNQEIADSLISRLNNENIDDTIKYVWLLEISFNHSDPKTVLKYAKELEDISISNQDSIWIYRALFSQGSAYRLMGDLDRAVGSYFKGAFLADEIGHETGIGESYSAIGDVYSVDGNHSNSIKYYVKAISILRTQTDSVSLATTLMNAGDEYFNASKLDSAVILFEESGQIFKILNYNIGNAYNLGNIGLVYAKQGKHDLAEKKINEATEILERLGDKYPITVYDTYMADIYQQRGDFDRALQYAEKSYQVARELGLKEQIRDASLKLSELYQSVGDYERAYIYQSRYIAFRDSINNEETIRKMADLRTEYEVSQKQAEVDLLETQKRVQQIIVFGMAVVLLLLALLVWTLYRNNKQKQATNLLLSEQKEEIETQKDQLEALNHTKDKYFSIISHDLRGPVNSFKAVATLTRLCIEQNNIEELPEVYKHFDASIDQLSNLLDTLLDWAITQQGTIQYHPEKADLKVITDELVKLFANMAGDKNIELKFDVAAELWLWVDINSLKTILRNLVNNALKFTNEGGKITLSAETIPSTSLARVRVQDTGVGIPQEKLKTIFKLNDYNRSWGTKGEKGLGLGLQLVQEFTAMNKGTVSIESEENVGTVITLELPLYSASIHEPS